MISKESLLCICIRSFCKHSQDMSVFPQDSEEQLYSHRIFFFQPSRANCKGDGTVQLTVEL